MRWRLLVALLAFAAAAVAGFAWPLLMSTSAARTQRLVISRTADLDRFASLADQALSAGDVGSLDAELHRYTELYGEPLLVVDTRRARVLGGDSIDTNDPAVGSVIDGALRNQPARSVPDVRPWSRSPVLLARPVGTGTRVTGAIVLGVSVHAAALDVTRQWIIILAGALLAAAACTALAFLVSRWVLRPIRDLESAARTLASGSTALVRVSGPPELRNLESEFNRMSNAVTDAADQQRRLVADASHQLRNPLAALRLRIDTLGTTLSANDFYTPVVAELERLESLLDSLITLERADTPPDLGPVTCDATLAIADRLDYWTPAAIATKVTLTGPSTEDPILVACPLDELLEILDILLDNAIKYSTSTSTITVTASPGTPVHLAVADTGPGLPADQLPLATNRFWRAPHHKPHPGNGLGLSIATARLAHRSGQLHLTPTHPHGLTATITLPAPAHQDSRL
jgi:signal transduction histidine kinase